MSFLVSSGYASTKNYTIQLGAFGNKENAERYASELERESFQPKNAPAIEGYKGHGIFTYVLLNGLPQGDMNQNGTIELIELISHVDDQLPELSYEVFGYRKIPRSQMQGSNFAIGVAGAMQPKK